MLLRAAAEWRPALRSPLPRTAARGRCPPAAAASFGLFPVPLGSPWVPSGSLNRGHPPPVPLGSRGSLCSPRAPLGVPELWWLLQFLWHPRFLLGAPSSFWSP